MGRSHENEENATVIGYLLGGMEENATVIGYLLGGMAERRTGSGGTSAGIKALFSSRDDAPLAATPIRRDGVSGAHCVSLCGAHCVSRYK